MNPLQAGLRRRPRVAEVARRRAGHVQAKGDGDAAASGSEQRRERREGVQGKGAQRRQGRKRQRLAGAPRFQGPGCPRGIRSEEYKAE